MNVGARHSGTLSLWWMLGCAIQVLFQEWGKAAGRVPSAVSSFRDGLSCRVARPGSSPSWAVYIWQLVNAGICRPSFLWCRTALNFLFLLFPLLLFLSLPFTFPGAHPSNTPPPAHQRSISSLDSVFKERSLWQSPREALITVADVLKQYICLSQFQHYSRY